MKTTLFSVDIETDGPAQGEHSMIWFGVVRVDEQLETFFEGKVCPISRHYVPEALAVSGLSRDETLSFPSPSIVLPSLALWVDNHTYPGSRAQLWADNNGYDGGFLNYYLWKYAGRNPFGHSSVNIKNRYQGLMMGRAAAGIKDPGRIRRSFKHLVKTPHDHNPVNDARGNAEAILGMRQYGLVIDV